MKNEEYWNTTINMYSKRTTGNLLNIRNLVLKDLDESFSILITPPAFNRTHLAILNAELVRRIPQG